MESPFNVVEVKLSRGPELGADLVLELEWHGGSVSLP